VLHLRAEIYRRPLGLVVQHEFLSLQRSFALNEGTIGHDPLNFWMYANLLSGDAILRFSRAIVDNPEAWIKFFCDLR